MANIFHVERTANKITLGTTGTTINVASHTASLLLSLDASKDLASVSDLTSWVAGTVNQITVTDDTDGTITLSTPQNIHTGATPTFAGLDLTGLTDNYVPYIGVGALANSPIRISGANVGWGISPTTNLHVYATGTPSISLAKMQQTGGGASYAGYTIQTDEIFFEFVCFHSAFTGVPEYTGKAVCASSKTLAFYAYGAAEPIEFYTGGRLAANKRVSITDAGKVGINDVAPGEILDVNGNINVTGVYKVDDVQVVSNRVIDARCDDAINSGDATTDGVIDSLRDAMVTHGLIAAA